METKEKKQVISAIQKATNILVTVGTDPSVDELAALLGLSLLLGKLDKHATAVFSGVIPPAISFLEPSKTFEDTVDGLRDFIIALNKDKADHLRYKLDGDVVKIFITPYKNTIIRDTDLQFSQGDFNVELILALGVENRADLDTAVSAHGRILHDATTITLTSGSGKSDLGEIDWHAGNASSLCEMLVSLARDLGENLLDEHIATALLTGIVSNTERFSNSLTTSDVMKTAANLMAAGANQQLIAARLAPEEEPAPASVRRDEEPEAAPAPQEDDGDNGDGTMQISHEDVTADDLPPLPDGPSIVDVERDKDGVLQEELDKIIPAAKVDLDDLIDAQKDDDAEDAPKITLERHFISKASGYNAAGGDMIDEPSMGGTLNATTEQAEEDSRAAIEDERNHVILSHDSGPALPPVESGAEAETADASTRPEVSAPAGSAPAAELPAPDEPEPADDAPEPALAPKKKAPAAESDALADLGFPEGSHPTLAELDKKTNHAAPVPAAEPVSVLPPVSKPAPAGPLEVDDARAAVASALDSAFAPANNPAVNVGSQPLGEVLHAPAAADTVGAETSGRVEAPAVSAVATTPTSTAIELPPLPPLPPLPGQTDGLPPLPPLPDLGELDAHADAHPAPAPNSAPAAPSANDWQAHTVEPPATNDPGQFRIPGQK